jgi:hypothetical protein
MLFREKPFTLLSVEDVLALPEAEWLVEDMIEVGGLTVLYGPSGVGKSFIALEWAASIATARDWHGKVVVPGPVVYVAGEGDRSIGKRLRAHLQEHGIAQMENLYFINEPVQMASADNRKFLISALGSHNLRPRVIILDTLARCAVGLDENAANDMGKFVAGCGEVQQETGAAVVIIHHTGKNQDNEERGSSALRGAADTMIKVRALASGDISIESQKQKDDEPFDPVRLRLRKVMLDADPTTGRMRTSCVLVESRSSMDTADLLHPGLNVALQALATFSSAPVHSTVWFNALPPVNGKPVPERTFHNWRQKLLNKGLVRALPDRDHFYELTTLGAATARQLPTPLLGTATAATATPPEGGSPGDRAAEAD